MKMLQYAMIFGFQGPGLGPRLCLWHSRDGFRMAPDPGCCDSRRASGAGHRRTLKQNMHSADEPWDLRALEDLFAWIQRALERYARDPHCRPCLHLASEGLEQLRAIPGSDRQTAEVERLLAEMSATCLALLEGRQDWSPEGAASLLGKLRTLRGVLDAAQEAPTAAAQSPVMPLGNLLRGVPGDSGLRCRESPPPDAAQEPLEYPSLELLQRARREFQGALVELMYGRDSGLSFGRLAQVSGEIATALKGGDCAALFAAVEDLGRRHAASVIPASDELKALLGRVDSQLGHCVRGSAAVSAGGTQAVLAVGSIAGIDALLQDVRKAVQGLSDAAPRGAPQASPGHDGHVAWGASEEQRKDRKGAQHSGESTGLEDVRLERMRSQGQAEMARLAQAFAALEEAATADEAPAQGYPGPVLDGNGVFGPEVLRARLGEVELRRRRAVDALAQAASAVRALERVFADDRPVPGSDVPGSSIGKGIATAMAPDLVTRLDQATLAINASIGDASTALMQQHRAVEDLDDLLSGEGFQPKSP